MRIVIDRPPNFARIAAVFDLRRYPGAIFCYGNTIFHPTGAPLSDALIAHESVHSMRQGNDPEAWWERYLADPAYRLAEEIPAHQAEWRTFCAGGYGRQERRRYLAVIAGRLASPLYGGIISASRAREIIQADAA